MERRLAAIVIADVVGYSKLIRNDEEGPRAGLHGRGDDQAVQVRRLWSIPGAIARGTRKTTLFYCSDSI